ncbi:uncharacterized protein J8A68_001972 [[Candida] subhashii]|uniref:Gfd2/YDR514C-like C-terminal domain-containing protein n=1 Tax=[Candida] subhashii TaxID=561895 RepID=A0A8J5QEP8_9ASCO|nr:uncharacterized protein J8A68_001972 [[Candida] subhashii]KAG7664499.1 hypothetical protein J8A68_001972 [[Candida] subhashii]
MNILRPGILKPLRNGIPYFWKDWLRKRTLRTISIEQMEVYTPMTTHPEIDYSKVESLKETFKLKGIDLDKYLNSDHFKFKQGREKRSLQILTNAMKLTNPLTKPLISIDCEAFETSSKKLTEIGIAILDPQIMTPGSIVPQIQTIHLVILENLRLHNHKQVEGNKLKFIGGTSYVLTKKQAKYVVGQIMEKYITSRDGVLIGHNIKSDTKYSKQTGIKLDETIHRIDTWELIKLSRDSGNSLWAVLKQLEIPHAHLHNAANDAYYCLIAAISLCDPIIRLNKDLDFYLPAPPPLTEKYRPRNDEAKFILVKDEQKFLNDILSTRG